MTKWLLVGVVVFSTVAADMCQAWGARRGGKKGAAVIGAALAIMTGSFFAFLSLLAIADLSFAVPATAASIVLDTIAARYVLRERVDRRRWLAAALVACGVVMLA